MRKQTRSKMPLIRLMLVLLLAGMLFGAGFYAYYKRNAAQGLTLVDTIDQMKSWVVLHKNKLHEKLQVSKSDGVDEELPQEQVKFEFYDTLADMQVKVEDTAKQEQQAKSNEPPVSVKRPSVAIKHQKDKQGEINQLAAATPVVNPDEFEKAFYAAMTAKKK